MQPKFEYAQCDKCPLRDAKSAAPQGGPHAKLAIVGEAPGAEEVIANRPFVGRSGQLLDRVLSEAGYDRDRDVYLTNTVMCRPPDNNIDAVSDAIDCCKPRLVHELKTMQPQAVIALGNTAARVLLNDPDLKITKARGQTHLNHELGVSVRPTYHPAYVLRAANNLPEFRRDIGLPFDTNTAFDTEQVQHSVIRRVADLEILVALLKHVGGKVAYDLETDGLDAFANKPILCVALWVDKLQRAYVIHGRVLQLFNGPRLLNELFAVTNINWYAHNGKFDNLWLKTHGVEPPVFYHDTMLMHYAIDERRRTHGLKRLGIEYLQTDDWDASIYTYLPRTKRRRAADVVGDEQPVSYAIVPKPVLFKYAAVDVAVTSALATKLHNDLNAVPKVEHMLNKLAMPAVHVFEDIQYSGVCIDRDLLEQTLVDYRHEQQQLREQLCVFAEDTNFSPGSTLQLRKLLYSSGGLALAVIKQTPKGAPSTDAETLEWLQHEYKVPALNILLDYRHLVKIIGTYLEPIKAACDDNGRAHPDLLFHGTTTGRLSGGMWLTFMRPTRNKYASVLRRLIIADEGCLIVDVDYDQVELRVLATEARDEIYRQVFEANGDPHSSTAALIFGEQWQKQSNAVELRTAAKTINFGIAYGIGPKKLAMDANLTLSEAASIIKDYYRAHPAVNEYLVRVRKLIHKQGYLENVFGRRRRFELLTDQNLQEVYREGGNYLIQSTANEINLFSCIELHNTMSQADYRILLPYHDAIIGQAQEDKAEQILQQKCDLMERVAADLYSTYVPFTTTGGIGKSWADAELDAQQRKN